jgi:hypothetical protein
MTTQLWKAVLATGFVVLVSAWASLPVEPLTCGDTVGPGSGTVVLMADLSCSQAPLQIGAQHDPRYGRGGSALNDIENNNTASGDSHGIVLRSASLRA